MIDEKNPLIIEVVYKEYYYFDSLCQRESAQALIKEVFIDYDPNLSHAMRDKHQIGMAKKYVSSKILTQEELKATFKNLIKIDF